MQFQIPQFIETEDKIIGPLTLKQFLILAGSGLICFFLFFAVQTWLWFMITAIVMAIALAFAFLPVNGKPLDSFVVSAFLYYWNPTVYIFRPRNTEVSGETPIPLNPETKKSYIPTFGGLKSLIDSLTTSKSAIPQREQPLVPIIKPVMEQEKVKERYELIRNITGDREVAKKIDYR